MGLINLATNLADFNYYQAKGYVGGRGNFSAKKLPYGNDEPNDGSSNQPFIQTAIPATDQPLQTGFSISGDNILQGIGSIALSAGGGALVGGIFGGGTGAIVGAAIGGAAGIIGTSNLISGDIDYTSFKIPRGGTGGTDFLIRGGTLSAGIVADDVERLSKFFATTNGALFVTKQNLLSRTSVRTQASNGILNEGVYNPSSALLQAAGNIIGLHVNKQGLNPLLGLGEPYTPNQYFSIPKDYQSNRLYQLYSSKILDFNTVLNTFNSISLDPNLLLSYQGGPDSNIGIGNTRIRFATNNSGAVVKTSNASNSTTLNSQQINGIGGLNDTLRAVPSSPPKITDFRAFLRSGIASSTVLSAAPSYEGNKTIEPRTNSGDPGNTAEKDVFDYTTGYLNDVNKSFGAASPNSYDKINALPLYQSEGINGDYPIDDLISFRIGVVNNDNPRLKTYIHFRAFLDSISDQYKVEWKGTKYLGRGEDFYTYSGFDRQVSLSWTVVAQSKAELIPMYKKLNYLASICMPDYGSNGYMRGNLVTLTVGGYFNEQYGIITGFSYEMNDADATWEIGINNTGNSDSSVEQLPHLIKITGFNFIPIHNFVPRKQQNEFAGSLEGNGPITTYGKEHYISLSGAVSSNPLYNSTPEQVDTPFYNQQGLVLPNLAPILQFTTTPLGEEDLTPPGIIN
jgi:hypothetical protein